VWQGNSATSVQKYTKDKFFASTTVVYTGPSNDEWIPYWTHASNIDLSSPNSINYVSPSIFNANSDNNSMVLYRERYSIHMSLCVDAVTFRSGGLVYPQIDSCTILNYAHIILVYTVEDGTNSKVYYEFCNPSDGSAMPNTQFEVDSVLLSSGRFISPHVTEMQSDLYVSHI